jgi:hypothetical protein
VAVEAVSYSLAQIQDYKVNMVCVQAGIQKLPLEIPPRTINLDFSNNNVRILALTELGG